MAEFIFEIDDVLYDEKTGQGVMKPEYKGKLTRCKDCKWYEFDEPHRCGFGGHGLRGKSDYCSDAERKEE